MAWGLRSANQGNAQGARYVGLMHKNGWGVPRDVGAAVLWFARSAEKGDEESKQILRDFAEAGVPEAVAAARRLRLAP